MGLTTVDDDHRLRGRWLATAVALGCASVALTIGWFSVDKDERWQPWQDHGRWQLSEDRQTVRTERSQGCWEHRIRVIERAVPDLWRVQFERRPTGEFCTLAGCISHPDDEYSCGVELRLPESIPADAKVWALCPSSAELATEGPATTLPPGVTSACSERPERAS